MEDVIVPAGNPQAGARRNPVMILMSDGRPTHATTSYNNVQTSVSGYGNGSVDSTTDKTVFLTQLTAAWAKGKMAAHYNTTPKFYTVGLNTSTDTHATAVLNPSQSNNTVDGYWTEFMKGTNGENVVVEPGFFRSWSLYKDSNVAGQNYTDGYYSANNTAGLLTAFQSVLESIEKDAAGYVTLVDASGDELSGYVTITDELGCFMDVKDV